MTNSHLLSLVIPIYDEEKRIVNTLNTVVAYLTRQEYTSEVIVVDDGSTDRTYELARSFIAEHGGEPPIRLIKNDHRGKGYTVRTGMLNGKGKYILFIDADLATPMCEVGKIIGSLEAGSDVAIGTREGVGAERLDEPLYRHLMGLVFNLLVRMILGLQFKDTQAGFKGFRRHIAHDLFGRVQLYGADAKQIRGGAVTGFDVEVLYLATQAGYRIEEIPIKWQYEAESKVNPLLDSVRMLLDVVKVRWMAMQGVYKTDPSSSQTLPQ
jgi:glycosyltransferase involved in cell wall biosynthesis